MARGGSAKNIKSSPRAPFYNPFQDRAEDLKALVNQSPPKPPPREDGAEDDGNHFRAAMADVTPLNFGPEQARPTARAAPRPLADEDLEVLAQLADLVSGAAPLNVRDTDEYVEGARPGLSPDLRRRLAEGLFPVQDHLDLHGLNVSQAWDQVEAFLKRSRRLRRRCVLVIHGRGKSSPQRRPVLKPHLIAWLSRSGLRKHVLAFATAKSYDGGAGALYVLLKG